MTAPANEPSPLAQVKGKAGPAPAEATSSTAPPMSAPAARTLRPAPSFAAHAWWMLLLAALVLHAIATQRRIDRVDALSGLPAWSVDLPARDVASPTGWERGQRRLIVPGHHNPSLAWIREAQQTAADSRLRLREIAYDSAPEVRETRRTSPYRWWLTGVGWVYALVSGEPLGFGIERGARWADPLLFALMLVLGAAYAARFLSPAAACGFVIGAAALFPLAANFQPGAPDPHAMAWVLALASLLPLVAVLRRPEARTQSHVIVAGIAGGLAFWNDATTQAPVLLASALGGLAYEALRSRGPGGAATPVLPWRTWAGAGALTTLAASLFEFAPDHLQWSLNEIHPLHALVWWGWGEVMVFAGRACRDGRAALTGGSIILLSLGVLAVVCWPVVGLLTGSGGLLADDFHALQLANHPRAGVAGSLRLWLARTTDSGAEWATLLPALMLVVLLVRVARGGVTGEERGALVFVMIGALVAAALALQQLRWWNLFDVLAVVMLAALFDRTTRAGGTGRAGAIVASLLVLPGMLVGFPRGLAAGGAVEDLTPLEAQALIARDFAYWLNRRATADGVVLASTPVFAGATGFYGGFPVTASGDDRNEAGHLTSVRIASASTEQEAAVLLRSRGITHLALPRWDPMLDQLVRIGRNLPPGQELPLDAFAVALQWWEVPLWMRPLDYLIPNRQGFQGFELRAFALDAEQPPELGLSRLADFFVERGQLREAQSLRESLQDYPRSVVALGAIARVDLALRDRARLEQSLETLIPFLSRRAARDLPADRRISLAILFLETNRVDLAREQLNSAFTEMDEALLRSLTPGMVVNLLVLSRSLAMPFPSEDLERVALGLVPPTVRAGLTRP